MISLLILTSVLRLPSPEGLPPGAESLLAAALDSLRITPEQMNFDRNWAPSCALMDSTVLVTLQDVFALPRVLSERVALASSQLTEPGRIHSGLSELRSLLQSIDEGYYNAIAGIGQGCTDSLL